MHIGADNSYGLRPLERRGGNGGASESPARERILVNRVLNLTF
jgi:hypothetical protein